MIGHMPIFDAQLFCFCNFFYVVMMAGGDGHCHKILSLASLLKVTDLVLVLRLLVLLMVMSLRVVGDR